MLNRMLAATLPLALLLAAPLHADPDPGDWESVLDEARGQTVYWYAWAGEERINDYIQWTARQVAGRHDIELVHVKIGDTAEAVSRVLAEKQAGNHERGNVDLIWINGENFATMKANDLLFGPWSEQLSHYPLTDPDNTPAVRYDWTIPVDGLESPWSSSQVVFYYDTALIDEHPRSMPELLDWARENPGDFTYARVPNFLGNAFITQALLELAEDTDILYEPMREEDFDEVSAPLWAFLDELHPHLWRSGRAFPANSSELRRLMGDGEISIALSFSTTEASGAIANFELPDSVRSYVLDEGTLGNVHFVAIPFNSPHKAGAMAVANFLLSPEAQAHKQDLAVWGDRTVLDVARLPEADRARFAIDAENPAMLAAEALEKTLPEPHPSWMTALQEAWRERYVRR